MSGCIVDCECARQGGKFGFVVVVVVVALYLLCFELEIWEFLGNRNKRKVVGVSTPVEFQKQGNK